MSNLLSWVKAAWGWFWNWITVIAGYVLGAITTVPILLDAVSAVDIKPIVGPEQALVIWSIVALVKSVAVGINAARKAHNAAP